MIDTIKENGVHFTPKKLGDFLSDKILNYSHLNGNAINILDPSCGEGQLLLSISEKLKGYTVKLKGFDTDNSYVKKAEHNLFKTDFAFDIKNNDFLEYAPINTERNLFSQLENETELFDIIIANPPYVRTQVLGAEKSKALAKKYDLKGRVDLYYPFLIGMTNVLKENGIIGVLTSNRYLFTKSGESIRNFLRDNYEILEIIDLGDTKFFEAAVLPAIFIGRKKQISKNIQEAKFSKIYEIQNEKERNYKNLSNIENLLYEQEGLFKVNDKFYNKTEGVVKFPDKRNDLWILQSKEESKWIKTIDKNAKHKVEDFFKVKVGVKTTADNVFIRKDWNIQFNIPENDILKPLLSQENISKWNASELNLKILYPYDYINNKKTLLKIDDYPNAKKYFESHKEQLSSRKYLIDAKREWYEIWVTQNPALWKMPKVVFPDISLEPRFCVDLSGAVVNGNCYWIVAENPQKTDLLYLIQAIANSKIMTKYHDLCFNNKLYSGRRRYFSQYVEKYPLPDVNLDSSKQLIALAKQLNTENDKMVVEQLENKVEEIIADIFGVPVILD